MFQNNINNNNNNKRLQKSPQQRYETCVGGRWNYTCEQYMPTTGQCRQCGCFVRAKVKVADEKCPLGKW
tara:strand:+ start:685 stop:891 length:207 start_codon:yes stop_codon:yes gene_type:complete